jgi:hypothetical protein
MGNKVKFDFTKLYAQYPKVIDKMDNSFTSHQFILKLAQQNQPEYIKALSAYEHSKDPFRLVHLILAKGLRKHKDLLQTAKIAPNNDIFDKDGQCSTWAKIPPKP